MLSTRIEAIKTEYLELREFFRTNGQISFEVYIDNTYKKTLLLSVASYFESLITELIIGYARYSSNGDEKIASLIELKTLNRQYHTFFDWEKQNTNKFFSYFGDATKEKARTLLQQKGLVDAEKAFLSIGRERNKLIHNNYAEAIINFTFDEIYNQYVLACKFIEFIQEMLPQKTV